MKRLSLRVIGGLALVVLISIVGVAQTQLKVDLVVADNSTGRDTVYFGWDAAATYCIDAGLGEQELPPKPPTGVFDARLVGHRAGETCVGEGTLLDLHQLITKTDTFMVSYQVSEGGTQVTISWPDLNVAPYQGTIVAAKIVDGFGGAIINQNMLTGNQVVVTNLLLSSLMIITDVAVGVEREGKLIPDQFNLDQNYPNPFNPSTTVRFAIEKASFAQVGVYDILGRKVATLASEDLNPGFYSVKWNGVDDNGASVGSGVYFIRMTAKAGQEEVFSAVRKVMLMK